MLIFLGKLSLLGVVMMKRFSNWRDGRKDLMMRTMIIDGKAARARSCILVFFQIHKTRHGFVVLSFLYLSFTSGLRLGMYSVNQNPRI